ncbi:Hypothetical predicted protein [Olea europaea subsp. europaea]|nr:Hypothetical predicted protein [Olea europaea subsp. europaea]
MEPNNDSSGLSSYYHHSQLHHQTPLPSPPTSATATNSFPINAVLPNNTTTNNSGLVYPHTVPSAVSSPPETVKRKRGRPRKYGTPEQAAAAKRLSGLASSAASPKKRGQSLAAAVTIGSSASSSKKSQLASFGIIGQGFTPHVISVAAGEDVGQKIMSFVQQSKREICIMSASGSVSIACLHQPATSGGSVTYEKSALRNGFPKVLASIFHSFTSRNRILSSIFSVPKPRLCASPCHFLSIAQYATTAAAQTDPLIRTFFLSPLFAGVDGAGRVTTVLLLRDLIGGGESLDGNPCIGGDAFTLFCKPMGL